MKQEPRGYLAGGMDAAPDGGIGWRREILPFLRDELGHEVIDPTVAEWEEVLTPEEQAKFFPRGRLSWHDLKEKDRSTYRRLLQRVIYHDLRRVLTMDYIILHLDKYWGGGTGGEAALCFLFGIPIYLVASYPPGEPLPGTFLAYATEIFDSFDELKNFMRERYGKAAEHSRS